MSNSVKYRCSNNVCNYEFIDEGDKPCVKCGSKNHVVIGTVFENQKQLIHIRIEFKTDVSNERIFPRIMEMINKMPTLEMLENFCKPEGEVQSEANIPEEKWH